MNIQYHPAIEKELREIQSYYEERCPGLGVQFIAEFERQVFAISASPQRWMVITADIRRCLMRRFPYLIYFRHLKNDIVRITVVKHQRRHPQYGRERS